MAALQPKVHEYRRRFAKIESHLAANKPEEGVTFNITDIKEDWSPKMLLNGLDDIEHKFIASLQKQRRKNEKSCILIE